MQNDPDAVDFWEWQCSEIDDIPAADVREVVLCKDCKHLRARSESLAVYKCEIHDDYPDGEYFCADGEKREEI